MDRNAAVDNAVPAHGAAHVERSARLDESIQKGQAARRSGLAKIKPEQPSTNTLPALSNAPKLALPASLKKQG